MNVRELKEALDDFGDHLAVIFVCDEVERASWFEIDGMDTQTDIFETLVIDLERTARPKD